MLIGVSAQEAGTIHERRKQTRKYCLPSLRFTSTAVLANKPGGPEPKFAPLSQQPLSRPTAYGVVRQELRGRAGFSTSGGTLRWWSWNLGRFGCGRARRMAPALERVAADASRPKSISQRWTPKRAGARGPATDIRNRHSHAESCFGKDQGCIAPARRRPPAPESGSAAWIDAANKSSRSPRGPPWERCELCAIRRGTGAVVQPCRRARRQPPPAAFAAASDWARSRP